MASRYLLGLGFLSFFSFLGGSLAQQPGCIGFGSAPSGCGSDCSPEKQVCAGVYPAIENCEPGECASGTLAYCWYLRRPQENQFNLIAGAVGASYTPDSMAINAGLGMYAFVRCVSCDQGCLTTHCDTVRLEVIASPVTVQVFLDPASVCETDSSTVSAQPTGGQSPFGFSWSGGGTGSSFKVSPPAPGSTYRVTVTDASGCTAVGLDSLIVFKPTVAGTLKAVRDSLCIGGSTGIMELQGNNGQVVRWEKRQNGGSWILIPHVQSSYQEMPSGTGVWDYRVLVRNGNCQERYSDTLTLHVGDRPTPPVIAALPEDKEVCAGAMLDLEVKGSGQGGWGSCAVEYRRSSDGGQQWTSWNTQFHPVEAPAGTTLVQAHRACSMEGCFSESDSLVWEVRPDPFVTTQPMHPTPVCLAGAMEPIQLMAQGGTPSLQYLWEYEATPGSWLPVSDGLPAGAVYANATAGQGFSVSGISEAGAFLYRCRVSASGMGCEEILSDAIALNVKQQLNAELELDSLSNVDRKVGAKWKFEFKEVPPVDASAKILVFNNGVPVDSQFFHGKTFDFVIPPTALSLGGASTRFCVSLAYNEVPQCPDSTCTRFWQIDQDKDPLSVKLIANTNNEVLCSSLPLSVSLKGKSDPTTACDTNIDSSSLRIFQNGQLLASWDYSENLLKEPERQIDTFLPAGFYELIGCVFQPCKIDSVACDTIRVYILPFQLPAPPEIIVSGGGDRDMVPGDLVFCPDYTYELKGNYSFNYEGKTILGADSDFVFGQNNLGFFQLTTGSNAATQRLPVRFTVTGGCVYSDTLDLVLRADYELAADQSICSGDTLRMSVPQTFQDVVWSERNTGTDLSLGNALVFAPADQAASFQEPLLVQAAREGCLYLDSFDLQVVKVEGHLRPWPDSACARGLYHLAVAPGTSVSGYDHPASWALEPVSDFLWQVLDAGSGGALTLYLAGPQAQCRDTLVFPLAAGTPAGQAADSLFYDRCANTLLAPSGCPSGIGAWFRISKTTGAIEILSATTSHIRQISDTDTLAHTYVFHCQDPCEQVAVTRSADAGAWSPDCGDAQRTTLEVAPNPTAGSLRIGLHGPWQEGGQLEIRDIAGRLWIARRVMAMAPGSLELDVSVLAQGMYFLQVRDGSGHSATVSFIKH